MNEFKWIPEAQEKPPYGVKVLLWLGCEKCRNGKSHSHPAMWSDWNNPESFIDGKYCQGEPTHPHKTMQKDYWSPCTPDFWSYIPNPHGKQTT